MKKIISIIFALASFSSMLVAQNKTSSEIKGDTYYFVYAFDKAIDKYESTVLTEDGIRKYAASLQKMNRFPEAETEYAILVKLSNGNTPEDYFKYASVLKSNGKDNDYMSWMDQFSMLRPADLRAISYQKNKSNFNALKIDKESQSIALLELNTVDQDFGPAYMNDKIVFASSRAKPSFIKRTDNWTGLPFLNLYQSDVQESQFSKPEKFDKKMKSIQNDGPASFSKKGTFIAYTRNHVKDKSEDKIVELQIQFSTLTNNKWSKPVSFEFNNSAYSVGHPCLSEDGKTMYFTSDMPGGFGGADLYKTTQFESGFWSKPMNLGNQINTESNEMFPFYDEQAKILYFASDGHMGIGGLDLFYFNNGEVVNLGSPVNSKQDDFALIMNSNSQKGYFSSNRVTGIGSDDIYSVHFTDKIVKEIRIEGIAKTKDIKQLSDVVVTLLDEKGSLIQSADTKEDGKFSFKVLADKKFTLKGNKAGYLEGVNTAQTFGQDSIVISDLLLSINPKNPVDIEIIEVNADLGKISKLKPIYFDYDMYNIREDAALELDKIVVKMNKYPTMEVSLKSYTDCRGSADYNQGLSDKRATSSAEYIQARITNPSRISGKGYGETNSLNDCKCEENVISDCPKEEHQQNRRTEFIVIKK